ncbi:MAG: superoxide dismutase family protein [Vitreimonas sp.]
MRPLAAVLFTVLLGACASSDDHRQHAVQAPPRTVWIVGADGRAAGQATFMEGPQGVLIRLEFSAGALPPGWHGAHLHERGDCSDFANGFTAAGAHIGSGGGTQHGLMHGSGPEAGDLPNLFASPGGAFGAEFFSPHVTLNHTAVRTRQPLLDNDGSALIIHAAPDDQATQPIGGAGARLACAALTQLP